MQNESRTVKSLDGRYNIRIVDEAPGKPFHVWHVKHDEILPNHLLYVRIDPDREYDWQLKIDVNNILAVRHPVYGKEFKYKPGETVKYLSGGRKMFGTIIESVRADYWKVQAHNKNNDIVFLYTRDIDGVI